LKPYCTRQDEEAEPSLRETLVAGAVAGSVSKTAVAPLERAKIYFMTNEQVTFRLRKMAKWIRFSYRTEVKTTLINYQLLCYILGY
jgi:hypothetical protein